eukprot:TRINITY_DN175_c0_g5_i2.p1 TRINITY_DN175_c0_g5~~TRINITY_DN175_c0_g5_i2.p1  ORF type:complete len:264 (+),score=103.17 TRINITY_DN175_c0_g5_i2:75-794(+)
MGNSNGTHRVSMKNLSAHVHFSTDELVKMRSDFMRITRNSAHPHLATRENFREILLSAGKISISAEFADILFAVFAEKHAKNGEKTAKNGENAPKFAENAPKIAENGADFVNFAEFVAGLSVLTRGNLDEKMHLCFEIYDQNGEKLLEKRELAAIFRAMDTIFEKMALHFPENGGKTAENGEKTAENGSKMTENGAKMAEIDAFVDRIFEKADLNRDGRLSFEEFKIAVRAFPEIADFQ